MYLEIIGKNAITENTLLAEYNEQILTFGIKVQIVKLNDAT